MIFLEPGIDGRDGDDVIPAVAAAGFRCPIQLMSGLNAVLTEEARRLGERHGLTMLPVLEKPFRVPAVRQVIEKLGLRRDALASIHVTLADAIRHGWLELWYQPKIDLRARVFAGAEGYVRARHPEYGVVPPDSLFSRATTEDMLVLTQHVLATAMRDWSLFASVGLPIRFSHQRADHRARQAAARLDRRAAPAQGVELAGARARDQRGRDHAGPDAGAEGRTRAASARHLVRDRRFRPRLFGDRAAEGPDRSPS